MGRAFRRWRGDLVSDLHHSADGKNGGTDVDCASGRGTKKKRRKANCESAFLLSANDAQKTGQGRCEERVAPAKLKRQIIVRFEGVLVVP